MPPACTRISSSAVTATTQSAADIILKGAETEFSAAAEIVGFRFADRRARYSKHDSPG